MNFLKKLLVASLLLLAITSLGLWILSRSIKPDVLREYVSTQLTRISSQPTHINGDLSWQIFPQPGIKITDIQLGKADNTGDYSLHMNTLQFNLKIAPLLQGKLVFNEVAVKGFRVQIPPLSHTSKPLPATPAPLPDSQNPFGEKIAIDRLMLSRGQINIQNKDRQLSLSNLQIGAENINLQARVFSFQLKSNIQYIGSNNSGSKGRIQFKGRTLLSTALLRDPVTHLKSALLTGQLEIQNARSGQIKLDKVQANTSFKQGILQLNPLTIQLYEGQSIGDLRYELAEKTLQINQTASAINSAKLSRDLFGRSLTKGKLDVSLHAQVDMNQDNWQASALGNGNISIKDGSLESLDLNKIIKATSVKINKMLMVIQPGLKLGTSGNLLDEAMFFNGNTPFKLLSIPYRLEANSLHSEALLLQTDKLVVKGNSRLNLLDYALSGNLQATVSIDDDKVNKIQTLLGGYFPLLVKDNLSSPSVVPDFNKINPVLTKAWVSNTLGKPVRSITDSLFSFLPK